MLPVEIRLNILEFGGGDQLSLCLRDDDIIGRIIAIDTNFDYQEWRKKAYECISFIDKVHASPLSELYDYLQSEKICMSSCLNKKSEATYIGGRSTDTEHNALKVFFSRIGGTISMVQMNKIFSFFDRMKRIASKSLMEFGTLNMSFKDDPISLKKEIEEVWVYKRPRLHGLCRIQNCDYADIIRMLAIPHTLTGYLRYRRRYLNIQKHPLYPIYLTLHMADVNLLLRDEVSSCNKIGIKNIDKQDANNMIKALISSGILSNKVPVEYIHGDMALQFGIQSKHYDELVYIDKSLFPYWTAYM